MFYPENLYEEIMLSNEQDAQIEYEEVDSDEREYEQKILMEEGF